jgi:hypothetical protein
MKTRVARTATVSMLRREALEGGSMRKATVGNVLLRIGITALLSVAATGPTLAKKARASAYAETTKSAHYYSARDWKRRHKAHTASRQRIRPYSYAGVYNRRDYETELLLECLTNQPFVICPFGIWGAPPRIPPP